MNDPAALRFRVHNLATNCYSASDMRVRYAGKLHGACFDKTAREKRPGDDERLPSVIIEFKAFEGPLNVEWTSRDGTRHSHELDLAQIFKDRVVLHKEDPSRIDESMPMITANPTIVVEVNDRTLSLYMDVSIALRPTDPASKTRDLRRNRTLAYSKTF